MFAGDPFLLLVDGDHAHAGDGRDEHEAVADPRQDAMQVALRRQMRDRERPEQRGDGQSVVAEP